MGNTRGSLDGAKYRLIENRFQFQSEGHPGIEGSVKLNILTASLLLGRRGNYYEVCSERTYFRRAGDPEWQMPFVVANPHSQ